jgi:hemin uptake protein HemP
MRRRDHSVNDLRPNLPPSGSQPAHPLVLLSQDLFQGRREVVIRHGGDDYRLRITRQDKLILTK